MAGNGARNAFPDAFGTAHPTRYEHEIRARATQAGAPEPLRSTVVGVLSVGLPAHRYARAAS